MKTRFYETVRDKTDKNVFPKAILVGAEMPFNGGVSTEAALQELRGLAATAFYRPVASLIQKLSKINPQTLLGSGKVEELQQAVKFHSADVVIFDDNLSPAQNRNLENILKCRVIDRSWLILEIFSDHARTREAKTQVELARLKYALPRLTKMWGHLSRQRGGIGMRELGEKQIQLDRRYIRNQITRLERKLKQIDREKQTQRKSREGVFKVALVGYTNVGKSTLMNCLTGAQTRVEDKLFATLDSTIRKIKKNFPYPILVSDTVGLISKLPHDLVASFKSTLDEIRDADLIIKVVDISHPDFRHQMKTTDELMGELGAQDKDSLLVFNKIDRLEDADGLEHMRVLYPDALPVSSLEGTGIAEFRQALVRCYENRLTLLNIKLDYSQADLIPEIKKHALVIHSHYNKTDIDLELRIPPHLLNKVKTILEKGQPISTDGTDRKPRKRATIHLQTTSKDL